MPMMWYLLSVLEDEQERQKFVRIYEKYHDRMEKTAIRILLNQADAEDAVQNAFMRVIEHFQQALESPCEELAFWLISIVKNEALMILRKNKKIVPLEENWEAFAESAEETQSYSDLVALFARLPESYRSVLEMKMLIGYTDREIAERLGIFKRVLNGHLENVRYRLGKLVFLLEGQPQHLRYASDGVFRLERVEGNYLRDVILAVLALYVVYDLASTALAEIHIDIRHAHALRI